MAIVPTFPGVFVEEVPSGVRTITGVPTAIAAFVGRTRMGPLEEPVIINNFGEFERSFGGLDQTSSVSYAVRDFFQNGGGQAVVVRLFHPATTVDAALATITFTNGAATLALRAVTPGTWPVTGSMKVFLDTNVSAEAAAALGVATTNLFNLTTIFGGASETLRNLTLSDTPRRYDRILLSDSKYLRAGPSPSAVIDATTLTAGGTTDPAVPLDLRPVATVAVVAGGLDGAPLDPADYHVDLVAKTGIGALEKTDLFNLLCIPPDVRDNARPDTWGDTDPAVLQDALTYCVAKRAVLVVDPPRAVEVDGIGATVDGLGLNGTNARNAVIYFPRVIEPDPLRENRSDTFVPCGIVAGVMARTDAQRGVWKAPAGIDAGISGIRGLVINLTDNENGRINPRGINALRTFPIIGSVVWGARTLRGADQLADEYKYLPVRRLALFLEESLFRGLKFAVFEPNDEPLWAQIRLNVGAFMNNLFRQGAFQGQAARDAYFVKCDKETTTQNDVNLGVVNVLVGFAPLKPAEFVIIKVQQIAGQIAT
jgi:phage tail sheath protein FI